jgi:glucose/arabinose dehydrogenase
LYWTTTDYAPGVLRLILGAATILLLASTAQAAGQAAYTFRPLLTTFAPTHLAAPPSAPGRLYVVGQSGRVQVAVNGKLLRKPFLNIERLVLSRGGEQGLLSIAFHPNFATNRLFYVHYTGRDANAHVVEYHATKDGLGTVPGSARQIFFAQDPGPEHNGGQLAFGPDGKLYIALGDGECCDDPQARAQNLAEPFGKIWRVDPATKEASIAFYGLRNPWRFSFDRKTGDLYIGDVGAGLREEIDFLPRTQLGQLVNFGWDAYEGHEVKENKPSNSSGTLAFPIHEYSHDDRSCSVTGGFVYRGRAVPAMYGRYVFGDYCTGFVWSLRVEGDAAVDVRREAIRIPGLSTFGEDARGELYAASVNSGRVYKLVR